MGDVCTVADHTARGAATCPQQIVRASNTESDLERFANFALLLALRLGIVAVLSTVTPNHAGAQQSQPAGQSANTTGVEGENNGQDFTRPENLFQLRSTYLTAPGSGSAPGTIRSVTTDTTTLRADFTTELSSLWTLAFRNDLPFVAKNPITLDNPSGQYLHGLGDAFTQAAIIRRLDPRWAAGVGIRLVVPTGSDDLTSGKWQAVPVAGFLYSLPDVSTGSYLEALVRYDISVAGDPSKRNISNLQLAPMVKVAAEKLKQQVLARFAHAERRRDEVLLGDADGGFRQGL